MARYRLLEKTFINNMLRDKGEIVEYDEQPGSTMQPVDTESKVEIPENWQEENGLKRIALARSLGAPKQRMSGAEADLWISNELANRELNKAQAKAEAKTAPKPSMFTPAPKPYVPPPNPTAVAPSTTTPTTGSIGAPPHEPTV